MKVNFQTQIDKLISNIIKCMQLNVQNQMHIMNTIKYTNYTIIVGKAHSFDLKKLLRACLKKRTIPKQGSDMPGGLGNINQKYQNCFVNIQSTSRTRTWCWFNETLRVISSFGFLGGHHLHMWCCPCVRDKKMAFFSGPFSDFLSLNN